MTSRRLSKWTPLALIAIVAAAAFLWTAHDCSPAGPPPGAEVAGFGRIVERGAEALEAVPSIVAGRHPLAQAVASSTDPNPWSDVARGDAAYGEMDLLQRHGLLAGYPAGHFRRNRVLVRYEFSGAILRALRTAGLVCSPPAAGEMQVQVSIEHRDPELTASRGDLIVLSRLNRQFSPELKLLGADPLEAWHELNSLLRK